MASDSPSGAERAYDIVIFGATGFTGGKVAEYLARHAPPNLRWAIAGRAREKLESVRARLVALDARNAGVGMIEASVNDDASLERMAGQTRVLVTTVGPFIDYGEPVARACVTQGTDYIDSTGEPNFYNLLLGRYAGDAAKRNVRLVPSCGFDSIPADLGVLFTVKQLPSGQPIRLSGYLQVRAAFSGGTERSAIKSLAPAPEGIKAVPPSAPPGRRVTLSKGKVERRPDLDGWASPLPTIDGPIVRRSASSIDRYGPDFTYAHHALHPSLLILLLAAWFFGWLAVFAKIGPLRELLLKLVKKPGQGPTEEQMKKAWFKLRFIGESGEETVRTEVSGGDPGYGETSRMLAESALCLALDRGSLPARSGVLTPAEAMGDVLLERLQRAGMSFRVL
jgi:short subunit dehydrogenase-like uncharacterized protein